MSNVSICTVTITIVCFLFVTQRSTIAMDVSNVTPERSKLYEYWSESQFSYDAGEYRLAIPMAKKAIAVAKRLKFTEFQKETEAFLRDLERFEGFTGDAKKVIDEVKNLRIQANKEPVVLSETARLMKKAVERYQLIKEGPNDMTLLLLECDQLIAECQSSDSDDLPDRLKSLEERCVTTYGKKTFLYTAVLGAQREMLMRAKKWTEAADNAKNTATIHAELFPGSVYHIRALEAWTGSLGMAKRPKDAAPIIELACNYVEKNSLYKYNNLGVTAYLQAGEVAFLDGRYEDAEVAFDKAQKIINALRDGVIARDLIETLDQYHIECLVRLGRTAEADSMKERSSKRF